MNQYNEIVQNSTSIVNTLVYLLKSLEQSEKKNQNVILNSIDNLTSTFSVNNVESSINSMLNNIKKNVDDYILLHKNLVQPYPVLDNGSKNNDIIYDALQLEYKKIKRLESISNKQFSATKSIVSRSSDETHVKILTDSNFELYCKISIELNKTPINTVYQRIKTIWENKLPEFFSIFNKLPPDAWGSIGEPIIFTSNGLSARPIAFNDDWLKLDKVTEKNAIDLVSSDLGKLFNKLFCLYDNEFRSTFLSEYYPFVTDEPIGKRKMIKLFNEKFTDHVSVARGFRPDALFYTDQAVLMARGDQIKLTSKDCDCFLDSSTDEEVYIVGVGTSAMKRKKKNKKQSVKEKTVYRRTNADINKLISNVQTTLSNTAKNFQKIVENISSFYHSLDRQASQLFTTTKNAPKSLIKSDVEIIIGRCNTILKDNHANAHVDRIRTYFTAILKRMIETQNKNIYKEAYVNTLQYPQLCRYYAELLDIVDNKATDFNKLVIIKENNYNNSTKKIELNAGENFSFDLEKKRLIVKFKEIEQSKYVKNKFKTQLFMLEKQLEFSTTIRKYLLELNENMTKYPKFAKWFQGDIVLNIKRKYLNFRSLESTLEANSKLHPINNNEGNEYLKTVFFSNNLVSDKNMVVSWPEDGNFDSFNEMLRGFYGQLFYLDYGPTDKYNSNWDMNPAIRNNHSTKAVFPYMIYPSCNTLMCNFRSKNDLYHQHRLINMSAYQNLRSNLPQLVNFRLEIGDFETLDMATILLLQYFRDRLNFKDSVFNIKSLDEEIALIEKKNRRN